MRSRKVSVAAVAVAAFTASIAWAQGTDQAATSRPAFPFTGEVTAERLNVRLLANSEPDSLILRTLTRGATVTVVGEEGTFFRIEAPTGVGFWIWGNNGTAEGETFTVTTNDAPLRTDSRINATQVGAAPTGARLTIQRENLGWYRVSAPNTVHVFISSRHVRPAGEAVATTTTGETTTTTNTTPEPTPSADDEAWTLIENAQDELDMQLSAFDGPNGWDRANFQRALNMARQADQIATTDEARNAAGTVLRSVRAGIAAQEIARHLRDNPPQPAPEPPKVWRYRGYVESVGFLTDRPGEFRIVTEHGGEIVCYLRFSESQYAQWRRSCQQNFRRYVGINGTPDEEYRGFPVITLEEMERLEEPLPER